MIKNKIKILSWDPSITELGVAKSEYDMCTGKMHVTWFNTIYPRQALNRHKELTAVYPNRLIQLELIKAEVIKLCKYKPDHVVSEDAFCKKEFPHAFAALLLCIHVIETTVKQELCKPLFTISNTTAKFSATGYGHADKDTVQDRILGNKNIIIQETKANPIQSLTTHSCDAIAIAYSFCTEVLPGHLCSLPL